MPTGTTKLAKLAALVAALGLLASLWWGWAALKPALVWIPPGEFLFGDTVYPEEQPMQKVRVQGFWMDRTEVSNAQFADFVAATGYVTTAERPVDTRMHPGLPTDMQQAGAVVFTNPAEIRNAQDMRQWWRYTPRANWRHPEGPASTIEGKESHPVVAVTVEDAQAYARWAGRELPTEMEWEWAARGNEVQPSGNTAQPAEANTWQGIFPVSNTKIDGYLGTSPVGSFAPNGFGLYDMLGNVWELTADRFTASHSAADNLPPDQPPMVQRPDGTGVQQVIKGGSYLCAPNYCMRYRAGARQGQEVDLATNHIGFRTIARKPGP